MQFDSLETLYRLQIEIDDTSRQNDSNVRNTDDWSEKVTEKSFQIAKKHNVDWQCYDGPIYNFGIRLESDNKAAMIKAGAEVVRYLNKWKGFNLYY